jgi:WbqC-like protein family
MADDRTLPRAALIVTAHQPNYLPGVSVLEKIAAADAVIWLDEVQFSHGGWSNRNRMPDGSWLTVPVAHLENHCLPFNRVKIAEHGNWRDKHCRTLVQHYGEPATHRIRREIARPFRLLAGLNLACLQILLEDTFAAWHFQSHLDGGRAVIAASEDAAELAPISERLAMMVSELGGDVYLSGPSGRNYLDERPFAERAIEIVYHAHDGPNPCGIVR